ncbi:hypothetical protein LPJ66_011082, partial [Kickxella alabastrina]
DWEDDEQITDPDATQPEDWDEDAPLMIPDDNATTPEGWLVDELLLVDDPKAQKPEDWEDEEDGDWAAPQVPNPRCADVPGCGPWERPLMRNPAFVGKWHAPLIDNPRYKGQWAPRRIANPKYFDDQDLYRLSKIDAVGFELWTMQAGITFDNIYLGDSAETAARIVDDVWKPKHDSELAVSEALRPKAPPKAKPSVGQTLGLFRERLEEIFDNILGFYAAFQSIGLVSALQQERSGAFAIAMVVGALGWLGWNALIIIRFFLGLLIPASAAAPATSAADKTAAKAHADESEDAPGAEVSGSTSATAKGGAAFWILPDGPHDVFSLVTPADIRRIRDTAQENYIKLIDKVFDRLLVLKASKDLAKNPASTKQLLNCIRILTRLVPFVYEACPDGSSTEDIILWTQRPRPGSGADYMLGRQLVSAVVDLLFTSGFTVPPATVGEDAVVRYTIWENGIGQTASLGSSKEHIANRIEVLRLLLVLCSKTMYVPAAR